MNQGFLERWGGPSTGAIHQLHPPPPFRYFLPKVNSEILDFVPEKNTHSRPLVSFVYEAEESTTGWVTWPVGLREWIIGRRLLECQGTNWAFPWASLGAALIALCAEWSRNLLILSREAGQNELQRPLFILLACISMMMPLESLLTIHLSVISP